MSIKINLIDNKEVWDDFVLKFNPHSFLHSWAWGELQMQFNNKFWRLGVYDEETLVGMALIIKSKARRGTFIFCPHGPIIDWANLNYFEALTAYLKKIAIEEHASFIRISALQIDSEESRQIFTNNGFKLAPLHLQSEIDWILDIQKNEDELLFGMRKTTRYMIRKAEKEGVEIEVSADISKVKDFNKIYQATVSRQHFVPYSLSYLQKEFEAYLKSNDALLFFAKYKGEILSSAIIIFYGKEAFYHHGASIQKYPKIPASYLLQWSVIKKAKKRGCEFYNFWGIAPENKKNHPWVGLTIFKKGFGGFEEAYVPAQDLVVSGKYWFTYIIESVRRIKRGF